VSVLHVQRPAPTEHVPYYARYIDLVPEGSILAALETQIGETIALLAPLSEARARHRYAAGKWSVAEVVGHIADSERVFAYRALRFARADATELPGFEGDDYVANARFDERPLADVLREFESVRAATLSLFRSLDEEAWGKGGVANEAPVTVRALAWIIAGHELHHRALLAERYL
jgi:uncharacterized damage-inducible protein DinB